MPSGRFGPGVPAAALAEIARAAGARSAIRDSFAAFVAAFPPGRPYVYGRHTHGIIDECQHISDELLAGRSSFTMLNLAWRHGKSDLASRCFPAWHLLRQPNHEVILAAYNAKLAKTFSRSARGRFQAAGRSYGLRVPRERASLEDWGIADEAGGMRACGIASGATGHGSHLLVIDDYYASERDAQSDLIRAAVWDGFQSDLMTRLAPTAAVLIVAHRQHYDDLCGRILACANPQSEYYRPEFPVFRRVCYPAQSSDYATPDNPEGWLFPERFRPEYYRVARGSMTSYMWSAKALQDPQPLSGNLLKVDRVVWCDSTGDWPSHLRWVRGWDLASTEEERIGDDPDYTVGTLAAYDPDADTIYVRDVIRGRWSAMERERRMIEVAMADGDEVVQWVEGVGQGVDAFNRLKSLLEGKRRVRKFSPGQRDKVSRKQRMEALFEHGRVKALRGTWESAWLHELGLFPGGTHDDQVDSLEIAVDDAMTARTGARAITASAGSAAASKLAVWAKIEREPMVWPGVDRARRPCWMAGFARGAEIAAARPGVLARGWWLSRAEASAVVWAHVGDDGVWSVFDAYELAPRETFAVFAADVIRRSISRGAPGSGRAALHGYDYDVASGDDDDALLYVLHGELEARHDALRYAGSAELPAWLPPARVAGKSGLERLQRMVEAPLRQFEPGKMERLVSWPRVVLDQIDDARFRPGAVIPGGVAAPDVLVDGPLVKALRVLLVAEFGGLD